jgi:hypothetical protein
MLAPHCGGTGPVIRLNKGFGVDRVGWLVHEHLARFDKSDGPALSLCIECSAIIQGPYVVRLCGT